MATPLDLSVLQQFNSVFPFLLILVLVYAILSQVEWFREKTAVAAIIAVLVAVMSLLSPVIIKTVNLMAPWFVLFLIFIMLMMLAFMATGVEKSFITEFIKKDTFASALWITVIVLIIAVGSLSSVWTEETGGLETLQGGGDLSSRVESGNAERFQALFHPKVLGVAMVLLISFFTIKYMTLNE